MTRFNPVWRGEQGLMGCLGGVDGAAAAAQREVKENGSRPEIKHGGTKAAVKSSTAARKKGLASQVGWSGTKGSISNPCSVHSLSLHLSVQIISVAI